MRILWCLLLATACLAADPPVRRVDHILLAVPSVEEARRLHQIFTQQLLFPSAWPVTNYGTWTSGGVFLGNLNLELNVLPELEPYKFAAIAFEPRATRDAYSELRERGMIVDERKPFTGPGPDGNPIELFRNAVLPQLKADGVYLFFCRYSPSIYALNAVLPETLKHSNGGLLGMSEVSSISMAIPAQLQPWFAKLIAPANHGDFAPPFTIVPGERFEIRSLTIKCRAPQRAAGVLPERLKLTFSK